MIQESGVPPIIPPHNNNYPPPPTGFGSSDYGDINIWTSEDPVIYYMHYWTNNNTDYQNKMACLVKTQYIDHTLPNPTIIVFYQNIMRPLVGLQTQITINGNNNINKVIMISLNKS